MYRASRSCSARPAAGGPQIVISAWRSNSGAKNINPRMWSRCRYVSRMCMRQHRPASVLPSSLIPLPGSSTSSTPSSVLTCTQEVFPP
jgi:hypothetical protein